MNEPELSKKNVGAKTFLKLKNPLAHLTCSNKFSPLPYVMSAHYNHFARLSMGKMNEMKKVKPPAHP